jgi:hypothetical protein
MFLQASRAARRTPTQARKNRTDRWTGTLIDGRWRGWTPPI